MHYDSTYFIDIEIYTYSLTYLLTYVALLYCVISRPVLLEVPHFASTQDNEREVCVLKSENGISWTEHTTLTTQDSLHHVIGSHFEGR